jgi:sugar phosphate isomerase/epimerase
MSQLCYETINRSPFITPDFEADLPAQIRAAGKAGFEWTGIDFASIDQYCDRGGSLASLRRLLDDAGLRCFELQPLLLSDDFAETIVGARRAAEVAAALALEFLPMNALKSISDTRAFIARTGVETARIVVDTWHFFHGPDEWSDLEALSLDELAYPQFNDHPALESDDLMFETTQRRVLPGQGVFDLDRFSRTIREQGYDGPVSVEILSAELRSSAPEDFARAVFESASRYWR